MSELVVGCVVGYKQTFFISCSCSSDNTSTTNSGLDDWNEGAKFRLENTIEVIRSSSCDKAVSISEFREDTYVV